MKLIDRPNALTRGTGWDDWVLRDATDCGVLDGSVQFLDPGHIAAVLHKPVSLHRPARGCLARSLHAELPSNS